MIIFETNRLVARRFTLADANNFFEHNGNAELMRYIRLPKTRAESDAFLLENVQFYLLQPGLGRFAVMVKATSDFAGSFSLLPFSNTPDVHLGYVVMQPFWGKVLPPKWPRRGFNTRNPLGTNRCWVSPIPKMRSRKKY